MISRDELERITGATAEGADPLYHRGGIVPYRGTSVEINLGDTPERFLKPMRRRGKKVAADTGGHRSP